MLRTPTAFDKVADKFWQDYKNGHPIGGGMAFESQVRTCELDETVDSLKQLDKLLMTVKSNLTGNEQDLLGRTDFRNFLLFMGFYAGRVVAKHCPKKTFNWLPFDELKATYNLSDQDKFYKISALCPSEGKPFFVWLSVGAKLFGDANRKFVNPLTQVAVPESLYWAVQAYFDELGMADKNSQSQATQIQASTPKTAVQKPVSQPKAHNQKSKKHNTPPAKDPFDEIKADLINLPAHNTTHDEHYLKANDFLQKADKAMLDGVELDDKQSAQVQSALTALEKVANAGNTNAMLALAVYAFEGRLLDDAPKAVSLVQQASDVGDVRAQKLLSRLYYQGLGVKPSTEMGKLWLDRAALGGHAEAKKLQMQMNLVKDMKSDYRAELQSDKKMYVMIGLAGLFFVLIIWLSTKLMG